MSKIEIGVKLLPGPRKSCSALVPPNYRNHCYAAAVYQIAGLCFCERHYEKLKVYFYALREEEINGRFKVDQLLKDQRRRRGVSVVYYMQRSDRAIKIGVTKNLHQRKQSLSCQHGSLKVLAIHQGDDEVESQMHKKFNEYRINKKAEWFSPHMNLLVHIEKIQQEEGGTLSL